MKFAVLASGSSGNCTYVESGDTRLLVDAGTNCKCLRDRLRAVGADLKTLVGCYRLPVMVCAAAGLIPCLLFYAVTEIPTLRLFTANHPAIMIPVLVLMAVSIALVCIAGIRGRIAVVTRQSIVDNIREL